MARDLTTPVDRVDVGSQAITSIHFEIPHTWDGTKAALAKDSIRVDVTWDNYGTDGSIVDRGRKTLHFADWPQAFKDEANDLYTMIENWLEGQGDILGAGTTETI